MPNKNTQNNKMKVETVEKAIEILAYNSYLYENMEPHGKDLPIVTSLAQSDHAYTEKQGTLALYILKRYHTLFKKNQIDIDDLIANPVFDQPFRVIDYEKAIELWTDDQDKQWLEVKFPYNKKLIQLIRTLKNVKTQNLLPMLYDDKKKRWNISYNELTCYYLTLLAVRYDFKIVTKSLLDDYEAIRNEKITIRKPTIHLKDNKLQFYNVPDSFMEWWNENYADKDMLLQFDVLKQLPYERMFSLQTTEKSGLADKIASYHKKNIYVDKDKHTMTDFLKALDRLEDLPAMVEILGPKLANFEQVIQIENMYRALENTGYTKDNVSWGFTIMDAPDWKAKPEFPFDHAYEDKLPDHKKEEQYFRWMDVVEDSKVNKKITDQTKIIMVNRRIPRTLIASGITPRCVFALNDVTYMTSTETLRRMVENLAKRYYYTVNRNGSYNTNYEFM